MRCLILFLFVLTASACTKSEFCIEPNAVLMSLDFKTYDSSLTLVDTPLINGFIYNTDTDSLFEFSEDGLTAVSAPLRRTKSQQEYIVVQNGIRDTILVAYTSTENFISNGCGYQMYFELTAVGHSTNSIVSVKINNAQVNGQGSAYHLEVIY